MDNRTVGAGLRTHAAGFAFRRVDVHAGVAGRDGAETACIQARLSKAETADIRDHIILDRTVITGGGNDGYHIAGVAVHIRVQSHGKANPPADNLPFLVYTAAILGLGTGNYFQHQTFATVGCQFVFPRQAAHFTQNMVL